jgi:hypothetical protein
MCSFSCVRDAAPSPPRCPVSHAGPCPSEVRERGAASGAHGAWDVRCGPGALGRAVADVRRDRSGRGGGTRHLRAGRHQPPSTAGASWSHSPVSSAYQAVLNRGSRSRGGTSSSHAQSVISTVMSNPVIVSLPTGTRRAAASAAGQVYTSWAPFARRRRRGTATGCLTVRMACASRTYRVRFPRVAVHAVGAGQAAAYCLYRHHLALGERKTAELWHQQSVDVEPAPDPPAWDDGGRLEPGRPPDHRRLHRILRHLAKQTVRSRAISPVAGTRQLARRQRGRCSGRGMMVGVSVLG